MIEDKGHLFLITSIFGNIMNQIQPSSVVTFLTGVLTLMGIYNYYTQIKKTKMDIKKMEKEIEEKKEDIEF